MQHIYKPDNSQDLQLPSPSFPEFRRKGTSHPFAHLIKSPISTLVVLNKSGKRLVQPYFRIVTHTLANFLQVWGAVQ